MNILNLDIDFNESYADIENEMDDDYSKTDLKKLNGSKAEMKDALDSSGVSWDKKTAVVMMKSVIFCFIYLGYIH